MKRTEIQQRRKDKKESMGMIKKENIVIIKKKPRVRKMLITDQRDKKNKNESRAHKDDWNLLLLNHVLSGLSYF